MTAAAIGFGATFAVGDGASPEVFTVVSEVVSVTPPNISRDTVDVTHLSSVGRYREFIPGLLDGGSVTVEMNWLATSSGLLAPFSTVTVKNYRINLPSGSNWAIVALMTGFTPGALTPEGKQTLSATFKVTGAPVFNVS